MSVWSKKEAKLIFESLVDALVKVSGNSLSCIEAEHIWGVKSTRTPLQKYFDALKQVLPPKAFDENFLRRVYYSVFHTTPIPEKRNHILVQQQWKMSARDHSKAVKVNFWIDLDQLASLLNNHWKASPAYTFELECKRTTEQRVNRSEKGFHVTCHKGSRVCSSYSSTPTSTFLFWGCMASGMVSGSALLIVILAAASFFTMSTIGISAAVGVSFAAGLTSYSLFRASQMPRTKNVIVEYNPEHIDDILQGCKEVIESASMSHTP